MIGIKFIGWSSIIIIGIAIFIVIITCIKVVKKGNVRKKIKLYSLTKEEYEKTKSYLNSIDEINTIRKKHNTITNINKKIVYILLIVLTVATMICLIKKHDINILLDMFIAFIIFTIIITIILYIVDNPNVSKYRKEYKNKVIKNMIKDFDSSYEYFPDMGISEGLYKQSNLDNYDLFYSEDLIIGKIENLDLYMSDVHTETESTDSEGDTTYVTSFLGTYAYVDLKRKIPSNILISSSYSNLFIPNKGKLDKIPIDNESFNKEFKVCSDNELMTLRILTPDVTNLIIDFYNKTSIVMEIRIQNNIIYFKLHTGNLFEPLLNDEEKEIQNVYLYKCMLNNIREIIKELVKVLNDLEV